MSWFCLLVLYSVQSKHLPTTVHSIGGVGRLWFWCYTHTHTQTVQPYIKGLVGGRVSFRIIPMCRDLENHNRIFALGFNL